MKEKIGILGGIFDPVHNGHMIIARAAREQFGLDRVLIMTGGNPPHKPEKRVTPARIRHEMVVLAAEEEEGLFPFDYEVNKESACYTYETMTELNARYPDVEWYFIIGEDSLRDLPKWYKPEILVKKCVLLVYPRSGGPLDGLIRQRAQALGGDIRKIDAPLFSISSTEIRQRAAAGKSVKYFVPDKVRDYLLKHKLYQRI